MRHYFNCGSICLKIQGGIERSAKRLLKISDLLNTLGNGDTDVNVSKGVQGVLEPMSVNRGMMRLRRVNVVYNPARWL